MTSTTPLPLPASTGAGSADFSAPNDLGGAPADAARADDAPSFEDYCARERDPASDDVGEPASTDPVDAATGDDVSEADGADAPEKEKAAAPDDSDANPEALPLVTTCVRDAAMIAAAPPVAPAPVAAPAAESAEPSSTTQALPQSSDARTAQNAASTPPSATTPTVVSTNATSATAAPVTAAKPDAQPQTAGDAAASKPAALSANAGEAKPTSATKPEGNPANAGDSVDREKSAANPPARVPVPAGVSEKNFLSTASEEVVEQATPAGTGVAKHADDMKPAPSLFPRPLGRSAFSGGKGAMASESLGAEEISVAWKGWTNGGGERVSTAAQFTRLGDSTPSAHATFVSAPGFSAARTANVTPEAATQAARAFPADPTALLAPIGAAIERLVAHGRDQLSLTVKFEQGGSLSLKLALRDGQVATQIQTDVPGLEGAIKSAWGQLAQEWQGRGMKLADPQFTGGNATSQQHEGSMADGRSAARDYEQNDAATTSFGRGLSSPAVRRANTTTTEAPASAASSASTRRSLLTWA